MTPGGTGAAGLNSGAEGGKAPKDFRPNTDIPLSPTAVEAVRMSETWRGGQNARRLVRMGACSMHSAGDCPCWSVPHYGSALWSCRRARRSLVNLRSVTLFGGTFRLACTAI